MQNGPHTEKQASDIVGAPNSLRTGAACTTDKQLYSSKVGGRLSFNDFFQVTTMYCMFTRSEVMECT